MPVSGMPPLLVHPRHHRDPHLRLLSLLKRHHVLHPFHAHPVLLRHLSHLLILHLVHLLDGQPVHLRHLSLLLLYLGVVLLLHLLQRLAHHLTLRGHDLVQRSLRLGLDLVVAQVLQRVLRLALLRLRLSLGVSSPFAAAVLEVLLAHLRELELLRHHRRLLNLLPGLHFLDGNAVGVRHLFHPLRHLLLGHRLELVNAHAARLRLHLEHALLLLLATRLELLHGAAVVLSLLGHRDGHRALGLRLKFLQGLCFIGFRLRRGRPVSVSVVFFLLVGTVAGLAVVRVAV
mmetsp:Transcript_6642/g.30016  ORF Transcript_6642/g.30016 Transcript_6642/m.30016 type:complete len:288 (-) Transcript_6642:2442-3305(-)